MGFLAGLLGPLLGGGLGMLGQNATNKANLKNAQNAQTAAGQGVWNAGMTAEQLIQNLLGLGQGGGGIQPPSFGGTPPTFGGGIMGNQGQFMQPPGGQGMGSDQVQQFLMALLGTQMGQGGLNPGQMGQTPPPSWNGPPRAPIVPGQGQTAPPGFMHPGMTGNQPGSAPSWGNPTGSVMLRMRPL